jgi:RNA polymerase sigma-70 factor (ECF subfamily)
MPPASDLEGLYDAHAQALFGFLLNLTRNEEDTRDLMQELFLKLSRHPSLLDGMREPRAYLLRLAHNAAIDLFRRRSTREKYQEQLDEPAVEIFAASENPDEAAFRQALAAAMEELPPNQRAVVHLKLWEDLTFDQIASILDISINTAGSRYRYALDKLRQRLRPLYDETR